MVKKATFLQILLAAVISVIIGAYGLAAAKDKLMLKYLPVDHNIEMVRQENNTTDNPALLIVRQTNNTETSRIVKGHIGCLTCRDFDKYGGGHCPDCCLYGANNTLIHCQNLTDPDCKNPGPKPFSTVGSSCPECVSCNNTFNGSAQCPNKSARAPFDYTPCMAKGCPNSTKPWNGTKPCFEAAPDIWYCGEDNLRVRKACPSFNTAVESCQNFTNLTAWEKTVPASAECIASGFPGGTCWKYDATKTDYSRCITNCTTYADLWEQANSLYINATRGTKICPNGNCSSGFSQNCDPVECDKKIKFGCGNYTVSACVNMENDYREMLLGNIAEAFQEIDPGFRYKFVARSGEKYMISWQILCNVTQEDQRYNLYTMVKVWDQERQNALFDKPVYQSIVHQKALGSTFYINAQTGMDSDKGSVLIPGHAYIVKLYYFLPNDGQTDLEVDISLMQMILYRTKN